MDAFPFDQALTDELQQWQQAGLNRRLREVQSAAGTRLRLENREVLNFSSNDYLGLNQHPALIEAALRATRTYGTSSSASRLICGSLTPHHRLEDALAEWKGAQAALTFSSGYATAVGVLTSVLSSRDIVVLDKRVHACCVDGAKLSGAKLRVFPHNDLNGLERILKWANELHRVHRPRVLIVTESVFSMDGDQVALRELVDLKEQYGALLFLDEAHATGLFGDTRSGLAESAGVSDRIEIQMGTLGKSLGSGGGYVTGSRALIDVLVHRARSFLYSTAPPPAAAAAALAAVELVQSEEGKARCDTTWARAWEVARVLEEMSGLKKSDGTASTTDHSPTTSSSFGSPPSPSPSCPAAPGSLESLESPVISVHPTSAILPWILGDETRTLTVAAQLLDAGVYLPAIRYPTVARNQARLRLSVSANHSADDVQRLRQTVLKVSTIQPSLVS